MDISKQQFDVENNHAKIYIFQIKNKELSRKISFTVDTSSFECFDQAKLHT
jgi:hypothetical protein